MPLIKKKKIIVAIVIFALIIIAFIGGQSYSKYVSQVKGEGTVDVATWKFKVNEQKEQIQQINLQSTCDKGSIINGKIAPGTSGGFNILVDATGSEVAVDYNINFLNEKDKPTNMKFIYDNKIYNTITELENVLSGTINANEENKQRNFYIQWEWKYETGNTPEEIKINDALDTKDIENISRYTFDIIVSGTQASPKL
jgi:hypothetical protein